MSPDRLKICFQALRLVVEIKPTRQLYRTARQYGAGWTAPPTQKELETVAHMTIHEVNRALKKARKP